MASRRLRLRPQQPPRRERSPAAAVPSPPWWLKWALRLAVSLANAGAAASEFTWSADAKEKLDRLPSFVKPMVQSSVEAFARKQGYQTITLQVMDDSKSESSNGIDLDA